MELKPLFNSIVDAIHEKDGLADGIAAIDFPQRIREIPSDAAISSMRPADWLPMPVPEDDEIYMLVLIPDKTSTLMGFQVTCTGQYTVELGTVEDGAFVYTRGKTTLNSGSKYTAELFADDFVPITSEGLKQVMIKISGTNITTWTPAEHPKRGTLALYPIFDFRCRLPNGEKVKLTNAPTDVNHTLFQLRFFSWEGPNQLVNTASMFDCCYSLTAVLELDTSKVTNMSNMFRFCYTLFHVPNFDTSKVTNMSQMFYDCYSLANHPDLDTSLVTSMSYMFRWNLRMRVAPKMDYSNVTNLDGIFYGCASLGSIANMNIAKATTMSDAFKGVTSMAEITFDPDVTDWRGVNIDLSDKAMNRDALVAMFNSLPLVTVKRTLNIMLNYGVSNLSTNDKAIATGKNWSLSM